MATNKKPAAKAAKTQKTTAAMGKGKKPARARSGG
jgi:hypothetical protein